MSEEWTKEELIQVGSLMRLRERRRMEGLHNAIVEVIASQRASPQITLMVLRLLEQEVVNDYMVKLFAPKRPVAATSPPVPKDTEPKPKEVKRETTPGLEEKIEEVSTESENQPGEGKGKTGEKRK